MDLTRLREDKEKEEKEEEEQEKRKKKRKGRRRRRARRKTKATESMELYPTSQPSPLLPNFLFLFHDNTANPRTKTHTGNPQ